MDGQVRKWAHKLVDHDLATVRAMVERSRDSVMRAAGFDLDVLEQKVGFLAKPR